MLEQRTYLVTHRDLVEGAVRIVAPRLRRLADELEETIADGNSGTRLVRTEDEGVYRLVLTWTDGRFNPLALEQRPDLAGIAMERAKELLADVEELSLEWRREDGGVEVVVAATRQAERLPEDDPKEQDDA